MDASIILGVKPLPSPAEMQDQRTARDIQQQEVELRRQEILARRDALREQARLRSQPQAPDPAKQKQAAEYQLFLGQTVADKLRLAQQNPEAYPYVRQLIGQLGGQEVLSNLPEQYDPQAINAHLAAWPAHEAAAKAALQKVTTLGGPDGKTPVERFVVPKEGDEYAVVPKAAEGGANIGSFEDYLVRTYGANPTPEQVLTARQKWARSDDAPGGGGGARMWISRNGQTMRVSESEIQPGDTPLTQAGGDTAQDRQRNARTQAAKGFLARLNELREKINTKQGPSAGVTGLVRRGAAWVGMDPDVAEYERERAAGGRALAVAIMGAQNLSDADAKSWADMLPGATVDKETASRLMRQVESMLSDSTGAAAPPMAVSHGPSATAAPAKSDGWTDLGGGVRIRKKAN